MNPLHSIQTIILDDIRDERDRQDSLRDAGLFDHTLAEPGNLTASECLAVVAEEFGEVSRVVVESLAYHSNGLDTGHLREELVQLAACCVAWCEALDQVSCSDSGPPQPARAGGYTPPNVPARPAPFILECLGPVS